MQTTDIHRDDVSKARQVFNKTLTSKIEPWQKKMIAD
jgi:hypothetical protein